jgi:ADP-ribose pyrophosphatase YjhB (NUDIX family)
MSGEDHYRGEVTQRGIVFDRDGRILLVRMGLRPWTFPGGRIDCDERPEGALRRKLREEIDVNVTVERPVKTVTDVWGNEDDQPVFAVLYYCEALTTTVDPGDDYDNWTWVTPEDAIDRMPFASLENAIEQAVADWQAGE